MMTLEKSHVHQVSKVTHNRERLKCCRPNSFLFQVLFQKKKQTDGRTDEEGEESEQNRRAESDGKKCQLEPVHIKEEKYMER